MKPSGWRQKPSHLLLTMWLGGLFPCRCRLTLVRSGSTEAAADLAALKARWAGMGRDSSRRGAPAAGLLEVARLLSMTQACSEDKAVDNYGLRPFKCSRMIVIFDV